MALVTFGIYSTCGWFADRGNSAGMDLAIYHQGIRALSRGHAPWSAIEGGLLWGDHFDPVIVVLAPLYWLWDSPQVLVHAQAALLGAGVGVVVACAQRVLTGWGAGWRRDATAALVGASLLFSPGVQGAGTFEFHDVALGVPLVAAACTGLVERRRGVVLVASLLLLTVKEDAGTLVFGVAVVCALLGWRRLAAALAVVSVCWTVAVVRYVVPALSPSGAWTWGTTLGGPGQMVVNSVHAWFRPGTLTVTVVTLVVGTGVVGLRSRLALAAVPSLLARGLSDRPAMWSAGLHYNLLVCTVLAFAVVDALRVLPEGAWRKRATAVLTATTVLMVAVGPAARCLVHGVPDPASRDHARATVARIPTSASVAGDAYLSSILAAHHVHTQLLRPGLANPDGSQLRAEYVVVDRTSPADDPNRTGWQPAAVRTLQARGYRIVSDDGILVVLHRSAG